MWRSLSKALEEYCKRKNIQHALEEARVVRMWPEIIVRSYGDVAPTTKASNIQNNILYVWVNEPLWVVELEKRSYFFSQQVREETGYPLEKIVFIHRFF